MWLAGVDGARREESRRGVRRGRVLDRLQIRPPRAGQLRLSCAREESSAIFDTTEPHLRARRPQWLAVSREGTAFWALGPVAPRSAPGLARVEDAPVRGTLEFENDPRSRAGDEAKTTELSRAKRTERRREDFVHFESIAATPSASPPSCGHFRYPRPPRLRTGGSRVLAGESPADDLPCPLRAPRLPVRCWRRRDGDQADAPSSCAAWCSGWPRADRVRQPAPAPLQSSISERRCLRLLRALSARSCCWRRVAPRRR